MKLNIASKVILIGVVSISGVIGVSLLRDYHLNKLYDIYQYASTNAVPSLNAASDARDAVEQIELSVMRYLNTQDISEIASLDAELMDYQLHASQAFDIYQKDSVSDNQSRALMQRARSSYAKYLQKIWSVLPAHTSQFNGSPIQQKTKINQTDLKEIHALAEAVDMHLQAMVNYNVGVINKNKDNVLNIKEEIQAFSMWVTVIVTFVMICLIGQIRRSALKELGGEPEKVVESIDSILKGRVIEPELITHKGSDLLHQICYLILHDRLTQLPNKLALSHKIQHCFGLGNSLKTPFTLFEIKINGFKDMADVIGQEVVGTVTLVIINRLQSVLPNIFTLASIDGETLGVLLPNISDHKMVERYANDVLRVFNSPFIVNRQHVIATINIGIVCYSEKYQSQDNLFEFSRLALKHSKALGENHYQIYQEEFSRQHRDCLEIEGALHHVLQNEELELYYQPQVDIHSEQIIGAEALIRWKHPKIGMIPPDKFIPIAEKNGSIIEIGDWVMLTAFKAATAWNIDKITPIRISINLSPRQVSQKDFISKLENLMQVTGCKYAWIKLEITESLLMENTDETMRTLIDIADLGIPISMDDFGTGYSSLSYLTTYPISQVKIDRSFMNDIPTRLDKCEVVKMIMRIAEIIHADVVAEGVETTEQVEFLRSIKCNAVQGYYYYKPMPFDDFDQMVTALRQDVLKQQATAKNDRKKNKIVQFPSLQA